MSQNETKFRDILFPSSGNLNDYLAHIYRKYGDLDGSNTTCGFRGEENTQYD